MRVACILFVAACSSSGAQVAPAPVPAMFDLWRVPDRPQLVYRATGAALPPDTNDASLYYAADVASLSADPDVTTASHAFDRGATNE